MCYTPRPKGSPSFVPLRIHHPTSGRASRPSPCAACCVHSRDRIQRRFPMLNEPRPPNENHILSRLPSEDYERIRPHLEQVELTHSRVLHQAGGVIEYVYFPHNAMISLISHTAAGESVEVGVVGFEGMAGVSAVLGVDKSPHEAMVQIPD